MINYKIPLNRVWVDDNDLKDVLLFVEIDNNKVTFIIQGHKTGFDIPHKILNNIYRMVVIQNETL